MTLPGKTEIEAAAELIYVSFPATPQRVWPLLAERAGTEVWVKHENHTPIGAFKIRGGLTYMAQCDAEGMVTATRGNHGQSVAYAARKAGKRVTVVVPEGNSREKNAAMRAFGAELVVHGRDFQDAFEHALALADGEGLHFLPSFHPALVAGVATYSYELLSAAPHLDTLYVPIGLGSGICGGDCRARGAGAQDGDRRRGRAKGALLCAELRGGPGGLDQQRGHHGRRHGLPHAERGRTCHCP